MTAPAGQDPLDRQLPGGIGSDGTSHSDHRHRQETKGAQHQHGGGGHGHGLMMIACCIPMLIIAVVLVATGVAGPGFLLVAIGCTAMMALMMQGMGHGSRS